MPLHHANERPDQHFQTALRTVSELAMRMDWTLSELGHSRKLHGTDDLLTQLSKCRTEEELPKEFRDYIAFMENFLGVPIKIISVGPDREATIMR